MEDGTIGEIRLFAGTFAPQNWAFCDGTIQQIATNEVLFTVIGTQFGGDGVSNFALPKLAPLPTIGAEQTPINYIICANGMYPRRSDGQ